MKSLFLGLVLLLAVTANAQFGLPGALSELSVDCKETAVGQDIATDSSGLWSDREHHETLEVDFQNMGGTALKVSAVIYFLFRDASDRTEQFVDEPVSKDIDIPPKQAAIWKADRPPLAEHVDNIYMSGAGDRSGAKPSGWIVGCKVNGMFYPIKASSEALMDYAQSDEFKAKKDVAGHADTN